FRCAGSNVLVTVLQLPKLGDLFVDVSLLSLEALDRSIGDPGCELTSVHITNMTLITRRSLYYRRAIACESPPWLSLASLGARSSAASTFTTAALFGPRPSDQLFIELRRASGSYAKPGLPSTR